jgi:hypothetical protein
MKTIHLLFCTLAITLASCDNNDDASCESLLPPATTTGANTFGACINGKFFKPRDGRVTVNSDNKGLRILGTEEYNLEIDARDMKSDRTSRLLLHIEDLFILNVGNYIIDESNGLTGIDGSNNNYMHCRIWNLEVGNYQGYVSYPNSGVIEITKRELIQNSSHIFSGNFAGKLVNLSNSNDTITISLGRFDLDSFTLDRKRWD